MIVLLHVYDYLIYLLYVLTFVYLLDAVEESYGGASSKSWFCGQCRGRHKASQCPGVQGVYVPTVSSDIPLVWSPWFKPRGKKIKKISGSSSSAPIVPAVVVPGPCSVANVEPQFSGPQQAQVHDMTREQAEDALGGVIAKVLTNLARMESPQQDDRNKSDHGKRRRVRRPTAARGGRPRGEEVGGAW
ncbi:hypothetical protein F511_31910 [Dorcoceras hygrometricum]|uniref:Uncharacterized protein n=1 Tax=Dorcoceras hygrometricum TaxID=472368 RepID=A0A2Z7D2Q5_9LAMI|nr:hypothetical protein F511_31910 [Dorcoceras hygrometricum]